MRYQCRPFHFVKGSPNERRSHEVPRLSWAARVEALGRYSVRYGIVLVLLWIGGMKFTAYEAAEISESVASSPLTRWVYSLFSIHGFSALLGGTERPSACS